MASDLCDLYDSTMENVKILINAADPKALLAGGAPDDEYDALVADITRRLLHGEPMTATDLFSGWSGWSGTVSQEGLSKSLRELQGELIAHR